MYFSKWNFVALRKLNKYFSRRKRLNKTFLHSLVIKILLEKLYAWARLGLVPYTWLNRPCVTYRTPCYAIGRHVLLTQPFLGQESISPGVKDVFAHILSLHATSLINNCGSIFVCVKIMNLLHVVKRLAN